MITRNLHTRDFTHEISYRFSRSSGPGGQNVNKVNTKVEALFSVSDSNLLSDEEKHTISIKLASRINNAGELMVISQESRSQVQNKIAAAKRIQHILEQALKPVKRRKATQPSHASKLKRIARKKQHALKKSNRKRPEI